MGGDFFPVGNKNRMDPAGSGEQFVVGYRLAIKTTLGDDFEGHVLTYDKSSNIVVIHILPVSYIIFWNENSQYTSCLSSDHFSCGFLDQC